MFTLRKKRKQVLLFAVGVIVIILYCEFLIYYISAFQCDWPNIKNNSNALKTFILADTHLLGPRKGHWLDKWRRETQMHKAFQSIIAVHKPHVVFILGDLFDEGEWSSDKQFDDYVLRFYTLFHVPNHVKLHVVVGNHDIGFHHSILTAQNLQQSQLLIKNHSGLYSIRRGSAERFTRLLHAPNVQLITIQDNHFVLVNSMALHGDSCNLCTAARKAINNISEVLECSRNEDCLPEKKRIKYSRPILMQHFPLFRDSDAICTEPDAPPIPERFKQFRLKIDALSPEATDYIVKKIRPRAVFGGHTHHGCVVHHNIESDWTFDFMEYSVPSFSWRNRPDPKYLLAKITPQEYAVQKCSLPTESTIIIIGLSLLILLIYFVFFKKRQVKNKHLSKS